MIVLDIETSGLDPDKSSILSIGAVDFLDPKSQFYGECRIFIGAEVNLESLKIAGFSLDDIQNEKKQTPEELLRKFIDWLVNRQNQTIAGQNVHWDLAFLRKQCERSKIDFKFGYRIIDLHSLAYCERLRLGLEIPLKYNRTDINLDDILVFTGLPRRSSSHNALEDAKLEAECFNRIIFGKAFLDDYKDFAVPQYLVDK